MYLARKNGGVDNGNLYALKAVNLTFALHIEAKILYEDFLINERKVIQIFSIQHKKSLWKNFYWNFILHSLFKSDVRKSQRVEMCDRAPLRIPFGEMAILCCW